MLNGRLLCLGIEGTAHTFGCSIVNENGEILSDVRDMYSTEKGGMIPNEVALHHRKVKDLVIRRAIEEAKINEKDIDFVAFSQGPGIPPPLLVTLEAAKEIAKELKIPLIGVNHIEAHLSIGLSLTKAKDPVFVFTSGANTQIISYYKKYSILGECLSIAVGNALDKFGREIGLGFPAGPKIEELAKKGKYVELPYVVKGMDVEFSGIITAAVNKFKKGVKKEDLCYSLQETMFAMLCEVTERAMAFSDKKEALLIGGVAANKRLCGMLSIMCEERGAKFYAAPLKYSGDNPVMIGWQGILDYKKNKKYFDNLEINKMDIRPNWRLDNI